MNTKKPSSHDGAPNPVKDTADIFLTGSTVLNVYSGELLKTNIGIKGERIWYVGPSREMVAEHTRLLDMSHKIMVPGYIDPHFHPWFVYNPISFGQKACSQGITTLFCDNLIFYMLMGVDLFEKFIDALSNMPIKYFWFCRAVPQTPMATEDKLFSIKNLERLLKNPLVQSLGEITRWPEVIRGNPEIMEIIRHTKTLKKRVDSHTAGAKYEQLVVLSRLGVESCHEAINAEEVLDRLRLGLHVMLRESSLRQDLADLLRVIKENRVLTDRIMLTTDASTPSFYQESGSINHVLEIAIKEGIDPIAAYRMVTINPAVYLEDLVHPTPEMVISKGRITAKNGSLIEPFPRVDWEIFFPSASFSKRRWSAESHFFEIRSSRKRIMLPTIKLINPVITRTEWVEFGTKDGLLCLNEKDEFCYLALINRDGEWVTNGIIKGFGDGVEGIASSFNTAAEILAIGCSPAAMSTAVNRILEMKGGIVAVENGQIAYEFPMPLGGLMSDAPMKQLAQKDREFKEFLCSRGYPFHDPLYTLIFLPNDFLPDVRINYQGVVDIRKDKVLWPRRDLTG
ncbi:MAG: adenine deaminase [Deltaproteobacteria bacterium]|nr:adenine deaminase [Deltaproteobacteria bacterium]